MPERPARRRKRRQDQRPWVLLAIVGVLTVVVGLVALTQRTPAPAPAAAPTPPVDAPPAVLAVALSVASEPPGAAVGVERGGAFVPVGTTPLEHATVELPPGTAAVRLRLERAGHHPEELLADVVDGAVRATIRLRPLPAPPAPVAPTRPTSPDAAEPPPKRPPPRDPPKSEPATESVPTGYKDNPY